MGYANPDAMLREMSSDQFLEWIAFYQLEPWGMASLDWMLAHFKALYVNSQLKKGKKPYKVEKFLTMGETKKSGNPAPMDEDEDW